MRHCGWTLIVLGICFLVCAAPVHSETPGSAVDGTAVANVDANWLVSTLTLSGGYRTDQLRWDVAGDRQGRNPNVRSELTWSDVEIYQLKLTGRTVIKDRIYLRCILDYGTVVDGDNQDSDYDGDDRTLEFSRSDNGVDGNTVWDASIGIGPRFTLFGDALVINPLVGYSISEQDFNIVDGHQTVSTAPSTTPLGAIENLDSRYETTWKGPFIGIELMFRAPVDTGPFRTLGFTLSGEYYWLDYDADANWNLREDLRHPVSFTHEADADGFRLAAEIVLETERHWGISMGISMNRMTTDAGEDRMFNADGTSETVQLNEVRWRSVTVDAGLTYRF